MQDHNPTTLSVDEAKELLARCFRVQHGSGNCEVDWYEHPVVDGGDQKPIANGQFWAGGEHADGIDLFLPTGRVGFTGDDARALFSVGKDTDIWRGQNPTTLSLDEAKELLRRAYRYESRDSAFGDSEVDWYARELTDGDDQKPIADGYLSRDGNNVGITLPNGESVDFTGRDAWELSRCGNGLGEVGENSSIPRSHRPI